jgi:hypothetical protein
MSDLSSIRLGEKAYALVEKSTRKLSIVAGVVVGIHIEYGVTIRNDDCELLVPVANVFHDRMIAHDVAVKYNECIEEMESQEQEFTVCVRVTGRVLVTVRAKDPEMARCKANGKVCDMDFGPLEDIDWDGVYCEDEKDNRTDY